MRKTRKVVSILLVAAMLFTTMSAYAFSFDDWDPNGNSFVDDYYTNKADYYKTTAGEMYFPPRKTPHTVTIENNIPTKETLMAKYGKTKADYENNLGKILSSSSGNAAKAWNRDIDYDDGDSGIMGGTPNWSDNANWVATHLSASLIGGSIIQIPMYPGNRGFTNNTYDTIDQTGWTENQIASLQADRDLREFWEGTEASHTFYSFTPDASGKIYYISPNNAKWYAAEGSGWTNETVTDYNVAKALAYKNYTTFSVDESAYMAQFTTTPITKVFNEPTFSWYNLQNVFTNVGSREWINDELILGGTRGTAGANSEYPINSVFSKTFAANEKVDVPSVGRTQPGIFVIKWDDRKNTHTGVKSISYSVDSGAETAIANFDPATLTYNVEVPPFAESASVSGVGTLMSTATGETVSLNGVHSANATVTTLAEDGITTGNTYTITFTKADIDAYILDEGNASITGTNITSDTRLIAGSAANTFDYVKGFKVSGPPARTLDSVLGAAAGYGYTWSLTNENYVPGTYDVYVKGTSYKSDGVDSFFLVHNETSLDTGIGGISFSSTKVELNWVKAATSVEIKDDGTAYALRLLGREEPFIDKIMLVPAGTAKSHLDEIEDLKDSLKTATFKADGATVATIRYEAELAGQPLPTKGNLENATVVDIPALTVPEKTNFVGSWTPATLAAVDADYTATYVEEVPLALLSSLTYTYGDAAATTVTGFTATDEGGSYVVELPHGTKSATVVATPVVDNRVQPCTMEPSNGTVDLSKGSGEVTVNVACVVPTNSSSNKFTVRFEVAGPEVTITSNALTLEGSSQNLWLVNKPFSYKIELYQDRPAWMGTMVGSEILGSYLLTRQNARSDKTVYVKDKYKNEDDTYKADELYSFVAPEDGTILLVGSDEYPSDSGYAEMGYRKVVADNIVAMDEAGKSIESKGPYTTTTATLTRGVGYTFSNVAYFVTLPYDFVPTKSNGANHEERYSFIRQEVAGGLTYREPIDGHNVGDKVLVNNNQLSGNYAYREAIAAYENGTRADKPSLIETDSYGAVSAFYKNVYKKTFKAGDTVRVPFFAIAGPEAQDTPLVFVKWQPLKTDVSVDSIVYNTDNSIYEAGKTSYEIEVPYGESAEVVVTPHDTDAYVEYSNGSNVVTTFPAKLTATVKAEGAEQAYTFNIKQAAPTSQLTTSVTGVGSISAVIDDAIDPVVISGQTNPYTRGTKFALTATPGANSKFVYWVDENTHRILSTEPEYELYLGMDKSVTAVFVDTTTSVKTVIFKNMNGQILLNQPIDNTGTVTVPQDPTYMGYNFVNWIKDGVDLSIAAGDEISYDTLDEGDSFFNAGYQKSSEEYTVTVVGGTLAAAEGSDTYTYDTKITVTADAPETGKKFSHWTKNGNIVSYENSYTFFVEAQNLTVVANYVDESEIVAKVAVLSMTEPLILAGTNKIAFFAERNLPAEYTLVEAGVILYDQNDATFDLSTSGTVIATSTKKTNIGQIALRKANVSAGDTWYAKAYMIYKDFAGNMYYAYSDRVDGTYPLSE